MEADLALLALLVAGFSLVRRALNRWSIGAALAFVVFGYLLSDDVLGVVELAPDAEPIRLLAEVTLTLLLFADASMVRVSALARDIGPMARLLGVGLLLTIAAGTVLALGLFPGITVGVALLIGASLAPTDAALGQPVVANPAVPARIRRLLNVESGLNDGIATPFVLLAVGIVGAEATGAGDWLVDAVRATLIGVAAGLALGLVGGRLLEIADARGWASSVSRQLFVLTLALGCYLTAAALGGNGFIAAFVGGLAFGAGSRQHEEGAVRFTELQGSLLAIGVWAAFGLTVVGQMLHSLFDPVAILYAILSLTVIRMVPVAVALIGLRLRPASVLFIGWFGPRGLASLVFLVLGLEALEEAGMETGALATTVSWTVLLSVVLHGLTAGPLARRYGARAAGLDPTSPERLDGGEPLAHRTSWVGTGPRGPSPGA